MERDVGDNGTISVQLHFNPRAPHGARLGLRSNRGLYTHYFNPRAPHGARLSANFQRRAFCHFNPRAPHGARPGNGNSRPHLYDFNPRAPHGARPVNAVNLVAHIDFNPRAPHGARRFFFLRFEAIRIISIHALRMERDFRTPARYPLQSAISIHALRMERDVWRVIIMRWGDISIHALRMERDVFVPAVDSMGTDFNPRAPHGARPLLRTAHIVRMNFNPRAPHGARLELSQEMGFISIFQSTRSAWSATRGVTVQPLKDIDFNPRAPHGARRTFLLPSNPNYGISIHALRMERDLQTLHIGNKIVISIHALRMERDEFPAASFVFIVKFQSTRSAWSATKRLENRGFNLVISIHALRMERDGHAVQIVKEDQISIHALRMERDGFNLLQKVANEYFNPRAPHGARPTAQCRRSRI